MKRFPAAIVFALSTFASFALGADWLTDGGDMKRNNWQKDETTSPRHNVKGMKLLWKTKLDNEPRQMHSLLEPLVIGRVTTKSGPKEMVIQAGVSDNVYALDAKTGEIIWKRHFESTYKDPPGGRGPSVLCPGGMTANVTVGPGDGSRQVHHLRGLLGRSTAHAERRATASRSAPPLKFMPPNGKPYALNLVNNVIYTHSAQGCGGNPNMAYTYDLATHKVGSWGPAGGGMWGRSGPAVSKELVMYTGTGDGRWDPEIRPLRQRHHRGQAEPGNKEPSNWWITTGQPTPSGCGSATSTCRSRPPFSTTKAKST